MNPSVKKKIVWLSPLLIISVNIAVAVTFGKIIGKWAFAPVILIEWFLFIYFVWHFAEADSIARWLKKPSGKLGWTVLALLVGLIPMPIFFMHYKLLNSWEIVLSWFLLACLNPWLEEFYWRGLLADYTADWNKWIAVLAISALFAGNHAVFGINSDLLSGPEILISTFVMGVIWAVVYHKTNSLRWTIIAHFGVDFFSLSVPSFLDMYSRFGK